MVVANDDHSASKGNGTKMLENKKQQFSRDVMLGCELWTDGLICAFEFVRGHRKINPRSAEGKSGVTDTDTLDRQNHNQDNNLGHFHLRGRSTGNYWIPIGWGRISELLQTVQVDVGWSSQPIEFSDEEEDITVADVVAPYWERPVGTSWWCHVAACHPSVTTWLSNA